jgi:hypothetical protein
VSISLCKICSLHLIPSRFWAEWHFIYRKWIHSGRNLFTVSKRAQKVMYYVIDWNESWIILNTYLKSLIFYNFSLFLSDVILWRFLTTFCSRAMRLCRTYCISVVFAMRYKSRYSRVLVEQSRVCAFISEFCTCNSSAKTVLTFYASSITRRVDLVCEQLAELANGTQQ